MDKLNIIKNNRIKYIIISIIFIIFIFNFISPNYSATIKVENNATNQEIQDLINHSNSGDIIQFKKGVYNNISLIINKKLTLKGNGTTIITKNSQDNNGTVINVNNTFGFYFTKSALGSSLIGFNIISNSDYAVIVNSSSLTMTSNKINENQNGTVVGGSKKGGVLFYNSKDSKVNSNTIANFGGYGINIINSKNIKISLSNIINNSNSGILIFKSSNILINNSSVSNNKNHGIEVILSNYTTIINNKIEKNYDGIFLSNTKITNITNNFINNNKRNGINLNDITERSYIISNTISKNANGIQLNGKSINDFVYLNIIKDQRQTADTDLDVFETGNGIVIGDNYDPTSNFNIEYNTIQNNENFGVKNKPQFDEIPIGPNYYGNNGNHICPRILASFLTNINGKLIWGRVDTGYTIDSDGRIVPPVGPNTGPIKPTNPTNPNNNGLNNINSGSNGNSINPSNQNVTNNGKIENNTNSSKKINSTDSQYSVGDSGKPLLSKAYEIISNQISGSNGENALLPFLVLFAIIGVFVFGYLKKRKI
ncbi:right-handed parallel beta-helix repeat-containing protein [Methanobrevibacter sp. TMH8]|uniref:right-handed parallel beta-helix repeat-containing protein n=1 Tax=Methanobrevibacter sp. TMH8 TaxID=2848611 RepID=UPI001CCBAD9B|nr:right-handed parallel beta-helix repeat-containing protein [Methanobrevibacter sp. TMH8]MBZ9570643.1 right-handed parallel beta-helix repeat-containing protein [Methanobrevibacter sp. TMH8]